VHAAVEVRATTAASCRGYKDFHQSPSLRAMAYSLFALLGFFGTAHGWFLPGVAPHHFARGERVELKVNKLTSTQTQVNDNL